MRVLIVGSDNDLGQALHDILLYEGRHEVPALSESNCRWKSERQVKKALRRANCDLIVDTRIVAIADGGEQLRDLDVDRTHWLAKICQRDGVGYLYLSSARLFSGSIERLYSEDDYPDNEETLGQMMLWCEAAVRDSCERHLVLRLGPIFSHRGSNVFTNMLSRLIRGGKVALDSQQRGCPVAATDAARVVSALLDQLGTGADAWGIYHYCSSDVTNCYEFAEILLDAASSFSQFSAAGIELQRSTVPRDPVNQALDCNKIRNTFAIKQTPWRASVRSSLQQYFEVELELEH